MASAIAVAIGGWGWVLFKKFETREQSFLQISSSHPSTTQSSPSLNNMGNNAERTYIMVKVCDQPTCPLRWRFDLLIVSSLSLQPDGVQRGLVGNIIGRFEGRGFKLIALKLVHASPKHLEKRVSFFTRSLTSVISQIRRPDLDYEDLKDKPFFPGLIKYMSAGPVVAMVWEGLDAVKTGRTMLGATNPLASSPGPFSFRSASITTAKLTD